MAKVNPIPEGYPQVIPYLVVDNAAAEGVRYLHGVDVVVLVNLAPAHSDVGKLFGEYARRAGPVTLHDFLLALATALARGWLLWE